MKEKHQLQRCSCKKDRLKAVNICGSISTWFSILQPEQVAHRFSPKQVFLKMLQNSQENYLCQSLFFNKAGLRPATLLKKRPWHRYFPVNFAKVLRTPFSQNTSVGSFCATLPNMNERIWFLLLVPEQLFMRNSFLSE